MIGQLTSATKKPRRVVCHTGQSNGVGVINAGQPALPSGWLDPQTLIRIFWEGDYLTHDPSNGAFEAMNVPDNTRGDYIYTDPADTTNNPVTAYGAEQGFAHALADGGRPLDVIKAAIGALNSTHWAPGGDMRIKLFRYVTNGIAELEAAGYKPFGFDLLYMQGESDVIDGITAGTESRISEFIDAYRALSPYTANAKIVFAKLSTQQSSLDGTGKAAVNTAFANIAAAKDNVVVLDVDTLGVVTYSDHLHYTSASLLAIGAAFADLINQ